MNILVLHPTNTQPQSIKFFPKIKISYNLKGNRRFPPQLLFPSTPLHPFATLSFPLKTPNTPLLPPNNPNVSVHKMHPTYNLFATIIFSFFILLDSIILINFICKYKYLVTVGVGSEQ